MQIPVFAWPNAEVKPRHAARAAALLAFAHRIDVEAVLGCTGWALLVVAIVYSGN